MLLLRAYSAFQMVMSLLIDRFWLSNSFKIRLHLVKMHHFTPVGLLDAMHSEQQASIS